MSRKMHYMKKMVVFVLFCSFMAPFVLYNEVVSAQFVPDDGFDYITDYKVFDAYSKGSSCADSYYIYSWSVLYLQPGGYTLQNHPQMALFSYEAGDLKTVQRALFWFDTGSLPDDIQVISAKLEFTDITDYSEHNNNCYVCNVDDDSPPITSSNYYPYTAITGSLFTPVDGAYVNINSNYIDKVAFSTFCIRSYYDGTLTNPGLSGAGVSDDIRVTFNTVRLNVSFYASAPRLYTASPDGERKPAKPMLTCEVRGNSLSTHGMITVPGTVSIWSNSSGSWLNRKTAYVNNFDTVTLQWEDIYATANQFYFWQVRTYAWTPSGGASYHNYSFTYEVGITYPVPDMWVRLKDVVINGSVADGQHLTVEYKIPQQYQAFNGNFYIWMRDDHGNLVSTFDNAHYYAIPHSQPCGYIYSIDVVLKVDPVNNYVGNFTLEIGSKSSGSTVYGDPYLNVFHFHVTSYADTWSVYPSNQWSNEYYNFNENDYPYYTVVSPVGSDFWVLLYNATAGSTAWKNRSGHQYVTGKSCDTFGKLPAGQYYLTVVATNSTQMAYCRNFVVSGSGQINSYRLSLSKSAIALGDKIEFSINRLTGYAPYTLMVLNPDGSQGFIRDGILVSGVVVPWYPTMNGRYHVYVYDTGSSLSSGHYVDKFFDVSEDDVPVDPREEIPGLTSSVKFVIGVVISFVAGLMVLLFSNSTVGFVGTTAAFAYMFSQPALGPLHMISVTGFDVGLGIIGVLVLIAVIAWLK